MGILTACGTESMGVMSDMSETGKAGAGCRILLGAVGGLADRAAGMGPVSMRS
jgi:hypothetical protein